MVVVDGWWVAAMIGGCCEVLVSRCFSARRFVAVRGCVCVVDASACGVISRWVLWTMYAWK